MAVQGISPSPNEFYGIASIWAGYFAKKALYLIIFKGFTIFQENWGTPQPVPWAIAYSPWWVPWPWPMAPCFEKRVSVLKK